MKIVWDEPKRLANIDKHGLDFKDVSAEFFKSAAIRDARNGRYSAFGFVGGVAVVLIFSRLGREGISLISLRRASRQERERP